MLSILQKYTFSVLFFLSLAFSSQAQVMIYEFYAHGGNSGARYNNDYIVLYNSGGSAQSLNGWSLQYASASGSSWDNFSFNSSASIPAMSYFLVILETTGTDGVATPSVSLTPTGSEQYGQSTNAFGNGGIATDGGKIALVNSTTSLSGDNPISPTLDPSIVDFVGYTSNAISNPVSAFEGLTPATNGTSARAVYRNNNNDTNNNGNDFARTPLLSNAAFPVEIISFKGNQLQKIVELLWQTSEELNNDGFAIQKSTNAKDFETIGFVKGQNEKSSYSFTDASPKEGLNYYRLEQRDFDGTKTFSKMISILYLSDGEISVYPNPALAGEKLNIRGLKPDGRYEVYKMNGQLVPIESNSELKLPSGSYVIKAFHPFGFESKKLIVH